LASPESSAGSLRKRHKERLSERIIRQALFLSAIFSIVVLIAILVTIAYQAIGFFEQVSIVEFLTEPRWTPLFQPQHFGVLPLVAGTLWVSAIALVTAVPIGLGAAVFLSEYAPDRVRRVVKPILEILAGIPTVVYGYFALTFVTPLLVRFLPTVTVFNALSAGLVMGIMIVPMVSSLSEDAMIAVPDLLREGAYALGARRHEVATRVVVPTALSGIVASIILSMSRAVGETMIVSIAMGSTPRLTLNPLESMQAMTAYITQISLGEIPFGTLEYNTIFAVGITLFAIVFLVNLVAYWFTRRYSELYSGL
jgi:phosphate transport system permease protein